MHGGENGNFIQLRDTLPKSVELYTGVAQLVEVATLGAAGALLAENNIIPNLCQQIADGYEAGDLAKVSEATKNVQRFSNIVSRSARRQHAG